MGDGMPLETLLQRTVGRWQYCPLWVFRGKMFSLTEKGLLIALLDTWHSAGRAEWFYATNPDLLRVSGLARNTFKKARRRLIQKCLIRSKPGKRQQASAYHLSQDLLYSLAENPTLKTSTYSGGSKVDLVRCENPINRMGVKIDPHEPWDA